MKKYDTILSMELMYSNRDESETSFIKEVCNQVLSQEILSKESSSNWGFVFVEGRPEIKINKLEHFACFHSCAAFSKFNSPIFCFINNADNFLNDDKDFISKYNIKIIKIDPITTLEEYSRFMISKVFFMLPSEVENIFTVSADSFLLKSGAEDWVRYNKFDLIGSHWKHKTSLEARITNNYHINTWHSFNFPPVYGCNLGFSYRKPDKMRAISSSFSNLKEIRQIGDTNCPEDVFYSYLGFGTSLCRLPTLKECDQFSSDPLTLDIWSDKENLPFGFHFFKTVSEFPPCNHE